MIILSLIISSGAITARTTFTITPDNPALFMADDQKALAETRFNEYVNGFFNENERIFPSALAMTNTLGYPVGKPMLGAFPHFEVGAAAGAGILEKNRYDNFERERPTTPFAGANVGFHFGLGITRRFDLIGKIFNLGWFYEVDKTWSNDRNNVGYEMRIRDSELLSAGLKARFNLVPRTTVIPFIFSFGGVNINLGFDYMRGRTEADLALLDVVKDVEVVDTSTTITTRSRYDSTGKIEWNLYSVTPEVLVYADFFYFLSIYTGPGLSFNLGSLDFSMKGNGIIQTVDPIAPLSINAGAQIGSATLDMDYRMKPYSIMTKWTVGIEFNLLVLKINVEAVSILSSPRDSGMIQFGARVHL
jgi:hypothetical protein